MKEERLILSLPYINSTQLQRHRGKEKSLYLCISVFIKLYFYFAFHSLIRIFAENYY